MSVINKIILRVFLLSFLMIVFNYIYTKWFYEQDIQKYSPIINLVRSIPDSTDILYVGESSNATFRDDDVDKRAISDFINDYYPNLTISHLTKPASHAEIYYTLLKHIPKNSDIKTVIVTLNLRSFNAQWIYSNLETSLQKSMVLLQDYPPLFNRFLLAFKGYDIKTNKEREQQFKAKWIKDKLKFPYSFPFSNVKEWEAYNYKKGVLDSEGNRDQAITDLKCHYIKAYGFQIDTNTNPRIKDFNNIVDLAKERGWNLVFNLLAENTQKANELVGKDLLFLMNENCKLLKNYYEKKGVIIVDNLSKIDNEQFIDQEWTTEHYAEKGRKKIAKNVAKALRKWHQSDYIDFKYTNTFDTLFFNDCDHNVIWGQMQTITTEKAFSGLKSSVTGNGNDYGLTFTYPLHLIPDSLKNYINIEAMIYQTNEYCSIVVETKGNNIIDFRKNFYITSQDSTLNKWIKYKFSLKVSNQIKQADLIKIYLYNADLHKVYIDDIRIEVKK